MQSCLLQEQSKSLECRMWPAWSCLPSAGFGCAGWTLLVFGGRSQLSTVCHSGVPITLFLGCSGSF